MRTDTTDVRLILREGPMRAFQVAAVAVCMTINMLDGFDILAIAFTGPLIAREWALNPAQLGMLFSSGLAGMTIGSIFVSPLADIVGRRALVLLCLTVISAGMVLSGFAPDLQRLELLRFVTGLGIGGTLSSINTIVVEYSSQKRKDIGVAFMTVGYPIGATVGGIASVYLIEAFGWRSVFVFGGALSALLVPVVLLRLPESLDFLLSRRPRNALARANSLLRRIGVAELTTLPDPGTAGEGGATSVFSVFDGAFFRRTAMICGAYFLTMLSFYFLLNWTPKVLVDQGLSLRVGISGSVLMNLGGVAGGLLLGLATRRFGLRELASYSMVALFAAVVVFGFLGRDLAALATVALIMGFFMIGNVVGLYATIAAMYPVRVRNTGTGLALGIGRIGAVAGPYAGGLLIAAGWSRPAYCIALALPFIPAAFLIRRVPLLTTTRNNEIA